MNLDLDLAFAHHLLVVDDDVAAQEVEALARSWFPRPAWVADHALQLSGDAVLTGPWTVSPEDRAALRLPDEDAVAYLLRCPVQRGGPAPSELAGAVGLSEAFEAGLPVGLEADVLAFLLAAARRLGGALRVAGSGMVLRPDPASEVNLWVHSPVWLEPEALVAVLQPTLPGLRLAMELDEHAVAPAPAETPDVGGEDPERVLDEGERAWLHAEAAAFDEAALAQPQVFEAYGAVADLGEDGLLEVAVEGEEVIPLALRGLDWTHGGVVSYLVRWWPAQEGALAVPDPGPELLAARARARRLVERAAVALHDAAGGEVTDESGFLVDPATFEPDQQG